LFGSLAPLISRQFFSGVNETAAFIFALLTFAAGFAVRPLGALVFGRIGDRTGRKKAFLITITMMGLATFGIGLLPTYATAGILAPILLIALRIDRKSTRLNSSHVKISYAVFCLKKKKKHN